MTVEQGSPTPTGQGFEEMREWAESATTVGYPNVHAAAIDWLFAPGESYDDAWLLKLWDVGQFIEAMPCGCTPEIVDAYDGCPRCLLLNRKYDEPAGRGR